MAYQPMAWVAKYKMYAAVAAAPLVIAIVPYVSSLFEISVMREGLIKNNLYDATSDAKYAALNHDIVARTSNCQIGMNARSSDGSCNNLENPAMGMAGIRFGRNVPLDQTFWETPQTLLSPNPREISRKLLTRTKFKPANIVNFAAASWLQFMTHDWFNHGNNQTDPKAGLLADIPLTPDDPLNGLLTGHLTVYKTADNPNTDGAPVETVNYKGVKQITIKKGYKNAVTHWWDGSQLYGSDEATLETVRGPRSERGIGEVRLENGRMPLDSNGMPITGFNQNWWIGIAMMHQLFLQEHNSIAQHLVASYPENSPDVQKRLAAEYPTMSVDDAYDRYIFDKARLINAAVMAKIHTVEWTPAILKNPILEGGMDANWAGLIQALKRFAVLRDPNLTEAQREEKLNETTKVKSADERVFIGRNHTDDANRSLFDKLLYKAYQLSDESKKPYNSGPGIDMVALDSGLVGTRTDLGNIPFSLTEEFVSVYRMHSLLRDQIDIYDHTSGQKTESIALSDARNADASRITERIAPTDLWYSFGITHPGALTLGNYPQTLQNLRVPYNYMPLKAIDMATVDILRDRERGVPRYNRLRALLHMPTLQKFEDFGLDPQSTQTLKQVYGNDINKVDLLIGCLAESNRPAGFGFGETAFQIFALMASRRLMADRFFSESYTADVYTPEGLKWVDDVTMKKVLLRHFPDLAPALDGAENGNAFRPWKGEINEG